MQRTAVILACLLLCTRCFAQQYPFVHYTPKDGLISNMVKNVYQDSRGRLYFTSLHGLSVYDGSRFLNYNTKNGLNYDIVNCIMEMGDDSIWIITNSSKINCLVNGKMKLLRLYDHDYIINILCRDSKGDIYAAAGDIWPQAAALARTTIFDEAAGQISLLIVCARITAARSELRVQMRSLKSYIFRSYKHEILKQLQKRRFHEALAFNNDESIQETRNDIDIDKKILLEQILARMDSNNLHVFRLLALGYSFEEIARDLGKHSNVIRSAFSKQLQKIKKQLEGEQSRHSHP